MFRQEFQNTIDVVNERLKATERYRGDMGIKQDAFLMKLEDWFDLRKAELKEWRQEQVVILEALKKEGNLEEGKRLQEEEKLGDEEKLEVGKFVGEKETRRRASGWARLKVAKKKSKKDLGEELVKSD